MLYSPSATTHSWYIHWPFCPYKCHFCPFVAIAGHDSFMGAYHRALTTEIERFAQRAGRHELDTLFFGGGTPSTYPNDLLLDMFGTLSNVSRFRPGAEISIEVNPGTVKEDQLVCWKQVGINRISIGVQSLNDATLKKLNRHQSVEDVIDVVSLASSYVDNISVDLILGLPEVTPEQWKDMLHRIVAWPVKHVSMYFLTVHEQTPLYYKVQRNHVALPHDEVTVDLYRWSVKFLAQHGIKQYEISNFAQPGFESRHNQVYWVRKPYKGFGLGACSFDGTARFQNEKLLPKYIKMIEEGEDPGVFHEMLTPSQVWLEKVMLGLRQRTGMSVQGIVEGHKGDTKDTIQQTIAWLVDHQYVEQRDNHITLTPAGLAVENEIVLRLSH